jgi:hypothetical protein
MLTMRTAAVNLLMYGSAQGIALHMVSRKQAIELTSLPLTLNHSDA